ncbi:hypothetical protein RHGRI_013748 [Rhododendron griersonianum]|uniref:TLC domain-containing protein n=1 Tax=Rhododendron griersonianum TaxID=479676 RepID=A0AAV6K780_9ERIC|nr:hypothetical protein RHGRI_013748 [Rhododendron griersonianum]
MDSIWIDNGGPSAWHFAIAIYFAFAFVAARFCLDRFIFRVSYVRSNKTCLKGLIIAPVSGDYKLAIWLLFNGAIPLKLNDTTQAKIVKCSESMWKLTYYATVEICILSITYHEPWLREAKGYFIGWPNQELKIPLKLFYMCQCGFYTYSIAALLTWETRRKDFSVMMSHHVVTVILISYSYVTRGVAWCFDMPQTAEASRNKCFFPVLAKSIEASLGLRLKGNMFPRAKVFFPSPGCSYAVVHVRSLCIPDADSTSWTLLPSQASLFLLLPFYSFFRIGSIILALHDASDVFMEAAKVFKYSEKELGASVCFGLFAISWLLLRLIFFPFWIIKSTSKDLCKFLRLSEAYDMSLYYVFNTMLVTLLMFHIYWWYLIWSMIMRQLKNQGKVGEDIRSDSEDDE